MSDIDTGTLTARRLEFVRTLESGAYAQCFNSLFESPASYCCIGVGRDVMEPGYFVSKRDSSFNDVDDYFAFRNYYGIGNGSLLVDRLIAMNDARNRDFPFIARFLRKVWGLTGA